MGFTCRNTGVLYSTIGFGAPSEVVGKLIAVLRTRGQIYGGRAAKVDSLAPPNRPGSHFHAHLRAPQYV
jgi:hypothetical protein